MLDELIKVFSVFLVSFLSFLYFLFSYLFFLIVPSSQFLSAKGAKENAKAAEGEIVKG